MRDFSRTVVDFEQATAEFHRMLKERGTWIDILPTNVGETIVALVGGSVAASQHLGIMATRNAFLSSAVRDSSIYAIVRQQGTKITRCTSAGVTVRLTNGYPETIFVAQYSNFLVGGKRYYNKNQLVFTAGLEQEIDLIQGEVKSKVYDLDAIDTDFVELRLGEPGFKVTSDLFIFTTDKVTGQARVWTITDKGLFAHTPDDHVAFESTTAEGDVSLTFGDGEYGAVLPRNSILTVRYIVSEGEDANGFLPGEQCRCIQFPQLSGSTVSSTAGGGNAKGSGYYKTFGPLMFRARNKAISATEIRAKIADYPGVADVAVFGQRDIAPQDKTWMNTMRICVLPENEDTWGGSNPNPKSAAWTNLINWITPQLHSLMEIETCNPTKVLVEVRVLIAVFNTADVAKIKLDATEAILGLFRKRPGILKRRLSKSDIRAACELEGVDYVEVDSFNGEESIVLTDPTSYVALKGQPIINVVYTERESE